MLLSQQEFSKFALDYLVFSNGFLEPRHNALGEPLRLETSLAKFTRLGTEEGVYWFVQYWKDAHQFEKGSVFHLIEPDINKMRQAMRDTKGLGNFRNLFMYAPTARQMASRFCR